MTKTERKVYLITKLLYPDQVSGVALAEASKHLSQLVSINRTAKHQRSLAQAAAELALAAQSKRGSEARSDHLESTLHHLSKVSQRGYERAVTEIDAGYRPNAPGPDYPDYEPRGVSKEEIEAAWAAAGEVATTTDERYFLFHQLLDEKQPDSPL